MSEEQMSKGQILFACREGNQCYFKLTGELRYTNASGMDDLIERLFLQEKTICAQVIVDLNEATFMDSTYIGLLASLARHCQQQRLSKPLLFSMNTEINQLLQGLCLDSVFEIVADPTDNSTQLAAIQPELHSDSDKARMILRAHEALLELSEHNRHEFQPIVNLLQKEINH